MPGESDQKAVPRTLGYSNLSMSYPTIREMEQLILRKRGLRPRELLCFELDKNEPVSTVFHARFHGYDILANATRGWGKTWEGNEPETPGFAAIIKMDDDDFVVISKTMRLGISQPGYRLKNMEPERFHVNMWVGERPLASPDSPTCAISLTASPRFIDQYRVRFARQ